MFLETKRSENICAIFCLEAKRKIGSKLAKRSEKIDEKFSLKHAKCKQNEQCSLRFALMRKKVKAKPAHHSSGKQTLKTNKGRG